MFDNVMLFEVLQSEGAAGWVGGCLEGRGEEADRYLGGEADCGSGFDQYVLSDCSSLVCQ